MTKKKQQKLGNKTFWISLIIIFFLSVFVLLSQGLGITGSAIQVISFAEEGSELFFEIRDVPCLKEANVKFGSLVKGGKIFFEENKRILFNGKSVCKFTISSEDETKIESMEITLKLKEEDLKGIADPKLITEGKELATSFVKKESDYVYYKATTSSIGDFIFGELKIEEPEPEVVEEVTVEEVEVVEEEVIVVEETGNMLTGNVVAETDEEGFSLIEFLKGLFNLKIK